MYTTDLDLQVLLGDPVLELVHRQSLVGSPLLFRTSLQPKTKVYSI